jgi:hypothetical protein
MNDQPETNTKAALHAELDKLLSKLPPGRDAIDDTQAGALWDFVAALVGGRGVDVRYHEEGLDAANSTKPSPKVDFTQRQRRRYHQAALSQFLMDVCSDGNSARPLPANFDHAVVVSDLMAMLEEKGLPQILQTGRKGSADLRRSAIFTIVMHVYYVAEKEGRSIGSILLEMTWPGGLGVPISTWNGWAREVKSQNRKASYEAKKAALIGQVWPLLAAEKLEAVLLLASEGPGVAKT